MLIFFEIINVPTGHLNGSPSTLYYIKMPNNIAEIIHKSSW